MSHRWARHWSVGCFPHGRCPVDNWGGVHRRGNVYIVAIGAALSTGLGTLLIVAIITEHPPAAGTVLGLRYYGWSWDAILFIIGSAVIILAIHIALLPKLINLI